MTTEPVTTLELRWRRAHALDLGIFNVAMFLFAALPLSTIVAVEWMVMLLSTVCLVGVVGHALPWRIPGAQWSYAATGVTGLFTIWAYSQVESVPLHIKIPYLALVLGGSASAYAAHVIDGAAGDV